MKKLSRLIFPLILALLCAGVIWFLHNFTVSEGSMVYIDWTTSVKISPDGTESPVDPDTYTNSPDTAGYYRFTGTLPEGHGSGYLLFEVSGEELTLYLNGEELYSSYSVSPEGVPGMSQARVAIPKNASGEVVMTCAVRSQANAMFPPLLRFMPDNLEETESMAYANLYGIPAGAAAVALLLTAAVFLLGCYRKQPDWSLIPLFLAALSLMFYRLVQSCGYFFLPESLLRILSWSGFAWLAPAGLAVYLVMNRRRSFWRLLGIITAWSAGILAVFYLISLAQGSYLSFYLHSELTSLLQSGYYDGLLTWITLWLTLVSVFISAYGVMRSFAVQQAETRTLKLKNELILENYQTLRTKMRDNASLRHEFRHQLTALYSLHRLGDYKGLGSLLEELKQADAGTVPVQYTENITLNAILQDAASRASAAGTDFSARIHVPDTLTIPESDLCILLMNMLDNALDACARISDKKRRRIRFQAETRNGFLTVKCENTYEGEIQKGPGDRLKSSKSDADSHGFAIPQMSEVAKRYGSLLDISYTDEHEFIVQTALRMPRQK